MSPVWEVPRLDLDIWHKHMYYAQYQRLSTHTDIGGVLPVSRRTHTLLRLPPGTLSTDGTWQLHTEAIAAAATPGVRPGCAGPAHPAPSRPVSTTDWRSVIWRPRVYYKRTRRAVNLIGDYWRLLFTRLLNVMMCVRVY